MNNPAFSCKLVRELDMVDYLASLGFQPRKITRTDYWYCSPLREEKTPSFKIDRKKNLWYDHGMGKGGNLIDFGVLFYRCSVSDLLQKLSGNGNPSFSFHPPIHNLHNAEEQKERIRVVEARELHSNPLVQYLKGRNIPMELACRYCREVEFELYGKRHLAIGFPNNAGGYELRNDYFKGCCSPKDITFIDHGASCLTVIEGFFSFLSYQVLNLKEGFSLTNFLVLNSLSFLERSRPLMEKYPSVHLYLDRDAAGIKATHQALEYGKQFIDRSNYYHGFKNLNDYLLNDGQRPKKSLRLGRSL